MKDIALSQNNTEIQSAVLEAKTIFINWKPIRDEVIQLVKNGKLHNRINHDTTNQSLQELKTTFNSMLDDIKSVVQVISEIAKKTQQSLNVINIKVKLFQMYFQPKRSYYIAYRNCHCPRIYNIFNNN